MSDRDVASNSATPSPVLDLEGTLVRFGGDRELFNEMACYLREDAPPLFNELSAAVVAKDAAATCMKAHALKGLVAGCGGIRAARAAQSLEDAGQAEDLTQAQKLLGNLESELEELISALKPYQR